MINSCIYNGSVIHKRFKPKEHFFKYKVFSLFIDLSELEELNKNLKFFSFNKFNLISFHEKDHGERDGSSLLNWVKLNLRNNNISTENIKIKLVIRKKGYFTIYFFDFIEVYKHGKNFIFKIMLFRFESFMYYFSNI